ncbi:ABC transporter permease [Fusibacter paucivorans]|uniref:Transport permease protein n=1 Tax=Fusibacter paucivorans TaxID=76009 RepID=A0ABS5PSZ8_9FIRM|nr:ABC transporter permease [Fusibacter paucivorans]MBS7527686.1 ABC transporter permease [Fusibacter paucivorans]
MKPILRIVYSSMKIQMKQTFAREMFRYIVIIFPLFTGLLMGFVYMDKSTADFVSYAMVGTATMTMWSSIAFSSASDVQRERFMGALAQIFNTPEKFYYIMLGKVLGNTLLGAVSMVISFIFVGAVFKVPINIVNVPVFLAVFFISVVSYMMIAMMLSGVLAVSRQARTLMNSMDYIIFLLTGSAFPITVLPIYLRFFSYALSPTYAIKLLRLAITGSVNTSAFYLYFVGLIMTTVLYFVVSLGLYRTIELRARVNATLEVI